jgi:hypothetical protein
MGRQRQQERDRERQKQREGRVLVMVVVVIVEESVVIGVVGTSWMEGGGNKRGRSMSANRYLSRLEGEGRE